MKKFLLRYFGFLVAITAMSSQLSYAQSVSFSDPKFSDPIGASSFGYKGAAKSGSTYYAIAKSGLKFNQTHSFPDTILVKNVEIKLIDADRATDVQTVYKDTVFNLLDIEVSSLDAGKYKLQAKVDTSTKVGQKDTTYVFTGSTIIDIQKTPSADFLVGRTIKTIKGFTIEYYTHTGGYEKGWVLTIDGKSPDNLTNSGNTPIEQSSKLAIVNECNGVQWFKKEMDAKVIIYPDPTVPVAISSAHHQCIPFDVIGLEVSAGEGYMGSWTYQWYDNGSAITGATGLETNFSAAPSWSSVCAKEIDKHKVELEYMFTLETGETLLKNSIAFTVDVYRQPVRPDRIVLKGNGTSHTYIALFDNLSDENLRENNYVLNFGDGEYVGNTLDRYYSYSSAPVDPWVQTMWTYEDGFKTYSAILYPDNSSRVLTDISSVHSEEVSISTEGLNYEIFGSESCSIRISSADGKILKEEIVYLNSGHIADSLDVRGLPKGVYMVIYTCGSTQKTDIIYIR